MYIQYDTRNHLYEVEFCTKLVFFVDTIAVILLDELFVVDRTKIWTGDAMTIYGQTLLWKEIGATQSQFSKG